MTMPNPVAGARELYLWPDGEYDAEFLGIMSYVLKLAAIDRKGFALI